METIDLNSPHAAQTVGGELVSTTTQLVARLQDTAITTQGDLQQAVMDRQQIGDAVKAVEQFFDPLKRMAHQLHKALCTREAGILAPLRKLDADKAHAISDFKRVQDRVRQQREQALAEQQRKDREAEAMAEAATLEHAGDHAMAAAVMNEAIAAPAPVVVLPDALKAVADLKFRRVWKWRYTGNDPARALQLLPREFLTPDERKIGAHATTMKDSAKLPGIDFYFEDIPVR
jgi:hypothetical protein